MIKCFLQAKAVHVQRLVRCQVILLYLAYFENCINTAMTRHKAALNHVDLNPLLRASQISATILEDPAVVSESISLIPFVIFSVVTGSLRPSTSASTGPSPGMLS